MNRKRVMIVDASHDTCHMVANGLQFLGFDTRTWPPTRGIDAFAAAVAAINAAEPDLVIYDIDPPYDSHWTVANEVMRDRRVVCPFIFTTTDTRIANPSVVGATQARVFLKPYELLDLFKAVASAVDGEPVVRERRHGERRHDGMRMIAERRARERRRPDGH